MTILPRCRAKVERGITIYHGGIMPTMTIRISDEAWRHVQQRIGFRARGQGAYLNGLILADAARRETRQLLQREQELVTCDMWEQTGNRTD